MCVCVCVSVEIWFVGGNFKLFSVIQVGNFCPLQPAGAWTGHGLLWKGSTGNDWQDICSVLVREAIQNIGCECIQIINIGNSKLRTILIYKRELS